MLQRPDFQNAGPQHLKVSSFLGMGAPKHEEPFKHLHECLWGVFLAGLCAFACLHLETWPCIRNKYSRYTYFYCCDGGSWIYQRMTILHGSAVQRLELLLKRQLILC